MQNAKSKTRNKPSEDVLARRKVLKELFPVTGSVRAAQIVANLEIGASTWWLYVKDGRVKPPIKFGARVSVWDAEYIRGLAETGIPIKPKAAA